MDGFKRRSSAAPSDPRLRTPTPPALPNSGTVDGSGFHRSSPPTIGTSTPSAAAPAPIPQTAVAAQRDAAALELSLGLAAWKAHGAERDAASLVFSLGQAKADAVRAAVAETEERLEGDLMAAVARQV